MPVGRFGHRVETSNTPLALPVSIAHGFRIRPNLIDVASGSRLEPLSKGKIISLVTLYDRVINGVRDLITGHCVQVINSFDRLI